MGLKWCTEMAISRSYSEILLFIITIFVFLRIIFRAKSNSTLPINWPIVGMLPYLPANLHCFHDFIVQLLSTSRMNFTFKGPWFTGMDMLITCDPDNVNYVFNTHDKLYPKGDDLMEMFGALGDCTLTTDGEKWMWHRRTVHRLLSIRKFQEYELQATVAKIESSLIPIMERCAQENKLIDIQDVFFRLIFDTTCDTFLGSDPKYLNYDFPTVPFGNAMRTVEEAIFYQHLFPKIIVKLLKILNVGFMKKLAISSNAMDQFLAQKIEEKITLTLKEEEENNREIREINKPADILAPFNIRDKSSVLEFSELQKSLKSNAKSMLLAAVETTVSSLAWFFWLLSKHPNVETKIINELKSIWPRRDNSGENKHIVFDKDSLQKLVYLHGAICEGLRLYPSIPFQHKSPSRTDVLPSGHEVKPGMFLIFHTYAMGRMESIWGKDCMEFKPERWINQKGEIRVEPAYKFFAFNCGPRTCLGKDAALNKMKIVIGNVLHNFHVNVVPGYVAEPKLGIILHVKNGLMVKVMKREI